MKKAKDFKAFNLLIDSTDIAIAKKVRKAATDDDYSAKLKHAGRRYQMVIDFGGRVRGMWGGYTHKIYDGHFIEASKTVFEQRFNGGVIIGDTHYTSKERFREVLEKMNERKETSQGEEKEQPHENLDSHPIQEDQFGIDFGAGEQEENKGSNEAIGFSFF